MTLDMGGATCLISVALWVGACRRGAPRLKRRAWLWFAVALALGIWQGVILRRAASESEVLIALAVFSLLVVTKGSPQRLIPSSMLDLPDRASARRHDADAGRYAMLYIAMFVCLGGPIFYAMLPD